MTDDMSIATIDREEYEMLLENYDTYRSCYRRLEPHNGWSNYMTWDIALWIDNEQGTYKYWRDLAEKMNVYDLADKLKDDIEEEQPEIAASLYSDILGYGLAKVNWYEIAKHLKED